MIPNIKNNFENGFFSKLFQNKAIRDILYFFNKDYSLRRLILMSSPSKNSTHCLKGRYFNMTHNLLLKKENFIII